jgi:hypothetical protein
LFIGFEFECKNRIIYLDSSYKEDRYDDVLLGAEDDAGANELTYGAGLGLLLLLPPYEYEAGAAGAAAAAAGVAHELAYEYAGAGGGAATAL